MAAALKRGCGLNQSGTEIFFFRFNVKNGKIVKTLSSEQMNNIPKDSPEYPRRTCVDSWTSGSSWREPIRGLHNNKLPQPGPPVQQGELNVLLEKPRKLFVFSLIHTARSLSLSLPPSRPPSWNCSETFPGILHLDVLEQFWNFS